MYETKNTPLQSISWYYFEYFRVNSFSKFVKRILFINSDIVYCNKIIILRFLLIKRELFTFKLLITKKPQHET